MRKHLLTLLFSIFVTLCPAQWRAGEELCVSSVDASHLERYFYAEPISDGVFERIWLKSFKRDCTTPRNDLRYLRLLHINKNGRPQTGELICNKAIAEDLLDIFRQLYLCGYRIEKIMLIDNYDADDETSMADNNTSCFNYRTIAGSNQPSLHGRGLAIDINPLINPCINFRTGLVQPANGKLHATKRTNRSDQPLRYINRNDLCYKLFVQHGFTWGGSWRTVHDYQHFEKRVR
ncbi:MAG: M15 family metallopeptidase [Bacteroidaceae bacterium]|nr:M15 family metallopeptidase [Bacteroidaceae bacterium]